MASDDDSGGYPQLPSEAQLWKLYQDGETIGIGRFAKVRMVTERKSGKLYAAKLVSKHIYQDKRDLLLRELHVMRKLDHEYVMKLHDAYESDAALILVCGLARGGDLSQRCADGVTPFSPDQARRLIVSLLAAVGYLHSAGVCHRDLKPENVLLSDETADAAPVVADFGLARFLSNPMQRMLTICGSRQFVAPEIIKCERGEETSYDNGVDVWGVGILTFFILCGNHPFMQDSNVPLEAAITSGRLAFPRYSVAGEAQDLLKQMLAVRPLQRISIEDALQHPWVTQAKRPLAPAHTFMSARNEADASGRGQGPAARKKPLTPMAPTIPPDLAYNSTHPAVPSPRARSYSTTSSFRHLTRASASRDDVASLSSASRGSSAASSCAASPSASLDSNFSEISISLLPHRHSRVHTVNAAPRNTSRHNFGTKIPALAPTPRSKSIG